MSTVVSRRFRSVPHRTAHDTWAAIVNMLAKDGGAKHDELMAVGGIAASIIADQAPRAAAITATCDGPRTRIYCLYDDDAIDGSDAAEDVLGYDPLEGQWALSLPCAAEDLSWVQAALKKHSARVTARDQADSAAVKQSASAALASLVLDPKGFLGS